MKSDSQTLLALRLSEARSDEGLSIPRIFSSCTFAILVLYQKPFCSRSS